MNQTVSIMGNISLHTNAGTAVQPFMLQGTKLEFQNVGFADQGATVSEEGESNGVKCKSEVNMEMERSSENSPSTFQSNGNSSFNSETGSPSTFTQSSSYSFQNYS